MRLRFADLLIEAQKAPEYYFGPLCDLRENNQARTGISINRDSELEDEVEWAETYCYLKDKHGDANVTSYRSSHWAVGWTEEIIVTAYEKDGKTPHPAFVEAMNLGGNSLLEGR